MDKLVNPFFITVSPKQEAYDAARAVGKVLNELVGTKLTPEHCKILEDPQTLISLEKVVVDIEEGNQFGGWVPWEKKDAVTEAIGTFRTNYAKYKELNAADEE